MNGAFSSVHMVHLPVHSSRANQIEIYFSVAERMLSVPATTPRQAHSTGMSTRHDLNQLLTRIGHRDRHPHRNHWQHEQPDELTGATAHARD